MRRLLLGLLVTFLCAEVAQARAWTRDQGDGTIRLRYAYLGADSFYGADFEEIEVPDYHQHQIDLYAELGLLDRWLTLSVEGTAYRWNSVDGVGSSNGVGDWRVGLWSGLVVTDHFRLTAGLLAGIPLGDDDEDLPSRPAGLPPGLINTIPPGVAEELPNGDGEFDLEGRLACGTDFGWISTESWPLRHFAEVELGLWYHTDQHEAITWSLKAGAKLPIGVLERLWLIASVFGVESFASEDDVEPILTGFGDGVSFTAWAIELVFDVGWGLDVSLRFDSAFRARALPATSVLSVGAGWTF